MMTGIFPSKMRFLARLCVVAAIAILIQTVAIAQSGQSAARPDRGVRPNGSYAVSDIENISLTNGNLNLAIPLAGLPPIAGGKLSWTVQAIYNSKTWDVMRNEVETDGDFPNIKYTQSVIQHGDTGGWRISGGYQLRFQSPATFDYGWLGPETSDPDNFVFTQQPYGAWAKVQLIAPDGSAHELRPLDYIPYQGVREFLRGYYWETPDKVGTMRYYSFDGSYIWARVNPSGSNTLWEVYLPDGTRIVQKMAFQRIVDTNGNSIKIITEETAPGTLVTHYQDEQGTGVVREIRYTRTQGNSTEQIEYQTVGGQWVTIELEWETTQVVGKIYTLDDHAPGTNNTCRRPEQFADSLRVLSEIALPQTEPGISRKFMFKYNSDPKAPVPGLVWWRCETPQQQIPIAQSSRGWGSLSEMTTPSGAKVKYAYELDNQHEEMEANQTAAEKLRTKIIEHDLISEQWDYNSAGGGATGSVAGPDGSQVQEFAYVSDPAFSSVYGGQDGFGGLTYRTVRYLDSQPHITIERHWTRMVFAGGSEVLPTGSKPVFNAVVDTEYTTLHDPAGNKVKTSAKKYQYDFNGNMTGETCYDWFAPPTVAERDAQGVPIGVPASAIVLRTTSENYHNQANGAGSSNVYAKRSVATATPLILNAMMEMITGPARTQMSYDNQAYGVAPIAGNVTRESHWDGTKFLNSDHTYDSFGNRLTTRDPKNNITTIVYDAAAHAYPIEVTVDPDPLALNDEHTSRATYDPYTGLVMTQTDPNQNQTIIDYTNQLTGAMDPFFRPGKVTSPPVTSTVGGVANPNQRREVITTYFDKDRRVETWSDLNTGSDRKLRSRMSYDQLGREVLTETSEDGQTYTISSQMVYRQMGRIRFASNPRRGGGQVTDGWTRTTNDTLGRVIEIATFSGSTIPADSGTNSSWTGSVLTNYFANSTTVTDQEGKLRRSLVDGLGRLIRIDEPDASSQLGSLDAPVQATFYEYDVLGNLTKVKQGETVQPPRMFSYDPLSRLRQAINPESGTITYQYDDNSNLMKKTDNRGVMTTFTYDGLNRVRTRTYSGPLPGGATPPVSYDYDAPGVANSKGRLTSVSSTVSSYTYGSYDTLGRVLTGTQTTNGQAYSMSYGYDLAGNMTSETYPSNKVVLMEYDPAGRLAGVKKQGSANYYAGASATDAANRIGYTAHGGIATMRLGNGLWEHMLYNSRLQPVEIGLGSNGFSSEVFKLDYTYGITNNNGNVQTQQITIPGLSQSLFQSYSYDSLNRLEEARENQGTGFGALYWKQRFIYDRYGNRNFDQSPGQTTPNVMGLNPAISQANNRIDVIANPPGWGYDLAGNLMSMPDGSGAATVEYDGENRQVKFTSGGSGAISTYSYDGDGRRVKRVTGGVATIFVYNVAGQLIAEYDDVASPPPGSGGTSYLTTDHLGSTRVVTGEDQGVKARYDYLPFGEALGAEISGRTVQIGYNAVTGLRQKFTQKERDGESGLDYFLARYYASAQGRFTSPDEFTGGPDDLFDFVEDASKNPLLYAELEEPQSLNKYQYAYNNPFRYVDPDGHGIKDWVKAAVNTGAEVAGGVIRGAAASLSLGYAPGSAPRTDDSLASRFGQGIGSAIITGIGTSSVQAGIAGGVLTSPTGVGVVAGAAVAVGGAVVTAGGLTNIVKVVTTPINQRNGTSSSSQQGNYAPNRELPRDPKSGKPIPDSQNPHTQLGKRTSKTRGETYTQAREFGPGGKHVKDIDFTNHGRKKHPSPHQHRIDSKTGKRGPAEPLKH